MTKVKLGEYANIKTGKLDANASSINGEYPFFTCSNEPLRIDKYSYDCECVLVAGNGDLNVKYYNGKFDAYQRTYIIESKNKQLLKTKYLYYLINSKIHKLRRESIGGVIKYIKLGNLTNIEIKLIDIEKQNSIIEILEKVQYLISKRKKQIEELDELIKSRFIELFENSSYSVFKLGDVCSKITDGTHKTPNYLDVGVTFISAKNIVKGELNFSDVKYISEQEYTEIQKRCKTETGDILLSKSGSFGSPVIVKTTEKIGLFESLAVIKYDRSKLLPEFLCEQLKSDKIQKQFQVGTKGVAIKHLHLGVIANVNIVVPPIEKQQVFASFVEQIDKSKFEIQKSINEIQKLQESLMSKYFG